MKSGSQLSKIVSVMLAKNPTMTGGQCARIIKSIREAQRGII